MPRHVNYSASLSLKSLAAAEYLSRVAHTMNFAHTVPHTFATAHSPRISELA